MATTTLPDPPPHGALRLADWGVIRAVGADAHRFLHGQLTNDIAGLSDGAARLAGFCSPKGRLLATFVVWSAGPEELLLACSRSVLEPVLKRLSMFVMRARCKLGDAGADAALWGVAGAAATTQTWPDTPWSSGRVDGGASQAVRLPDARTSGGAVPRWLVATGAAAPGPAMPPLDADTWSWLEVHSGVARVVAETSDRFVPQMVNLELVGGVDFQKGCYPGQEVVARSQYRGTLKRRAYVLDGDAPSQPGLEVFYSADPEQPAGLVALAGSGPGGHHAVLAELKIAAFDAVRHGSGTLHAGSADGPVLRPALQPYVLPAEPVTA